MNRKPLLLIAALAMAISSAVGFAACGENDGDNSGNNGETFFYELSDDGTYYSVLISNDASGAAEIPATYKGKSVKKILSPGFWEYTGLTSITIPNTIMWIADGAFHGCISLESITVIAGNENYCSTGNCLIETASKTLIVGCKNSMIPTDGSVTGIGSNAFYRCSGLTSIAIPDSVTSIESSAFYNCNGLTSITIPDSVTSIGAGAFSGCRGLTSITIPNSVTSIRERAFWGCRGLTSITIPDSVTSIGGSAFYNCSGLTNIYYTGNVAGWCGIKGLDNLMYYRSSNKKLRINGKEVNGDLVIPETVTSIGAGAFSGCSDLTSIAIPDSVTSIGKWALWGCRKLASVTIENTEGWKVSENSDMSNPTAISSDDLSDPAKTAEYLNDTYRNYYWKRS